jgi:hypothetical protein
VFSQAFCVVFAHVIGAGEALASYSATFPNASKSDFSATKTVTI